MSQRREPMSIHAFIAERAVKRLDIGVVRWLAEAAEGNLNLVMVGPQGHQLAGNF